jgi:tight adherence protein C
MSNLLLFVALVTTFFAVLLIGVALDYTMGERRRAVRMLEAQVTGSDANPNMREAELSQPFVNRALVPVVGGAGRIARRVTPIDTRDRLAKKLILAGSPRGWDAERVMAFKIIGAVGGLVAVFAMTLVGWVGGLPAIAVFGLFGFAGFLAPDAIIGGKVQDRQKDIRNSLSDTLDLLTISVEAGLSLNAALARVVQHTPGTLSQEFARMLQEIQLGVPRSDAFRNLAARTDVEELNAFTLAMVQADVFGVSIANVLRTQAQQLRLKRRQRAEQAAQKTPVKLVFPLVLCILPALFIVLIGPGAIRIFQNLLHR